MLAVAHALETHKTLTGDDVEAIIEGRPGPLVDGTPYATRASSTRPRPTTPRAVEAHRTHAGIDAPLPVMPTVEVASSTVLWRDDEI